MQRLDSQTGRIQARLAGLFVVLLAASAVGRAELFADPNLEAAVRTQVFAKRATREPLVEADVAQVSTVNARSRGVRSLVGLEKCRSLAMLDLAGNEVADLSPLSGLPRLQYLDLEGNQVTNLAPLASDPALQYLQLARNRVSDLTPLAGLTNLAALYLGSNRVEDASPLAGLRRLNSLYLDDNRLPSFESLGGLRGLSSLSLSGNRIEDLHPLMKLRGLQFLFLERNRLRDLGTLLEWIRSDQEQRFAPYVQIFLAGNPLGSAARRSQLGQLHAAGVRVQP